MSEIYKKNSYNSTVNRKNNPIPKWTKTCRNI